MRSDRVGIHQYYVKHNLREGWQVECRRYVGKIGRLCKRKNFRGSRKVISSARADCHIRNFFNTNWLKGFQMQLQLNFKRTEFKNK